MHRLAKALCLATLLCAPSAALAHDFWIQPDRFQVPAGEAAPMTLQVGHGPDRQRSSLPLRRVVRFDATTPAGRTLDLSGDLSLGAAAADGVLRLPEPGFYVVALASDAKAQSHLAADRFNAYAADEGLEPALAARARSGLQAADATERYSRQAKAIVQVGPATSATAEAVTRPAGLQLEIVPEVNPAAAPAGAGLPVRVFYEGKPLANALVKMTDLANDAAPFETHRTDAEGRARFTLPKAGAWLLNVVWTRPLKDEGVDFETTFSSLSFAVPAAP